MSDDAAGRAFVTDGTNVLAFPADRPRAPGAKRLLGDIVIAYETMAREAQADRKACTDHLAHLATHGFLHLLGYDHHRAAERRAMWKWQEEIFEVLSSQL